MIKSKIKRKLSFALMLLVLISAPIVFLNSFKRVDVDAQVVIATSTQIESEYAFGDVFNLPDCTFTLDGTSVKGSAGI